MNSNNPALNSETTHTVVACRGGDETALEQRPAPSPGAGEILLALRVVGFCGTDLYKLNTGTAPMGGVLGHELVGDVIALGEGVKTFAIGDRVAVPHHVSCGECVFCRRGNETMCEVFRENLLEPGGFSDTILVRPRAVEHAAKRLPDNLSDEAAVFMEPAGCVLRGIRRSGLYAGDKAGLTNESAAVLGAGSMGLLHLLVLNAVFPDVPVTVIDPVSERRAMASRLGAAFTAEPGAAALESIKESTADIGADAVFDTVGGNQTLEAGLEMTRQGGSVVLFAHAPGDEAAKVDLNSVFKFERRILGTYSASVKDQAEIFELLADGALDPSPLVTHSMPLDDFEKGLALVRNHQALKVLFTPSSNAGRP